MKYKNLLLAGLILAANLFSFVPGASASNDYSKDLGYVNTVRNSKNLAPTLESSLPAIETPVLNLDQPQPAPRAVVAAKDNNR